MSSADAATLDDGVLLATLKDLREWMKYGVGVPEDIEPKFVAWINALSAAINLLEKPGPAATNDERTP